MLPAVRSVLPAIALSVLLSAGPMRIAAAAEPKASSLPPLRTVAAAFACWADLDTDDQAVELEGVVINTMPSGAFRLHDGELGIFVTKSPAGQVLTAGERVAVTGRLRRGGFSPWISPRQITQLGPGNYPAARPATYGLLASGAADNQWVEIEGVVRAAELLKTRDFVMLDLGMAGGNLQVLVNHEPDRSFATLVDAGVRMHGVAAVNINKHGHVVEPSFRVPSLSEITILSPPPPDPFALPVTPVARLLKFSPTGIQPHRVRTRGVVTRRFADTVLFMHDGAVGLKVETTGPAAFNAGDVIDAAGFAVMVDGMAVLQQTVARRIGSGAPPQPATPGLNRLLDGSHNSDLVRIRARLVDSAVVGQNVTLIFEARDQLFKALINWRGATPPPLPPKNAIVHATGICVINDLEDMWFYRPRSFLLLVADLADLQILEAPPWWTPERLWWALAIAGAILVAGAGWVWSLRRQVDRGRAVLEQHARHAAALEERSRIARELHDTLEQGLTGLSLQMKAMETDLDAAPPPARNRLQLARQMLRESRALARSAIREMRAEPTRGGPAGLIDGLRRLATSWTESGALTVDVQTEGDVRPLPPRTQHHLLRIATEAVTNAVKHGRARHVGIVVRCDGHEALLHISDDGAGFDPPPRLENASGGFGLLGMHERARAIQGDIRIESTPGRGTIVAVTVSAAPAPADALGPPADGAAKLAPIPLLP